MANNKLYGTTFCGNEASEYAKKEGYLDYSTLSKAFDAVLNNRIMECDIGYWEQEHGFIDNSEEIEEINERIEEIDDKLAELIEADAEETEEYKQLQQELEILQENLEYLEEENNNEIYQFFIISESGADILKEYTDEIIFYNEELDMYVWGVTHYGTSWSYVLTNIKLNCGEDAYKW